jgi:hypothetical protein
MGPLWEAPNAPGFTFLNDSPRLRFKHRHSRFPASACLGNLVGIENEMTLLRPAERISQRWEGALEARLRQAPLETFLRGHELKISPRAPSGSSDNLIRAAIFFINRAEATMKPSLAGYEPSVLVAVICAICRELATLIGEPEGWRIPALVGGAQILSPRFGWQAAALISADTARQFTAEPPCAGQPLSMIGADVSMAVTTHQELHLDVAINSIQQYLTAQPRVESGQPENDNVVSFALAPRAKRSDRGKAI